jgi:hypothetical protein
MLDKLTTKHTFPDGTRISVIHRYALRYQVGERSVDIGFEQALEHGIDRLIHEASISTWSGPGGESAVTGAERAEISAKVKEYCRAKGLTFQVIRDELPASKA